MSVLTDSVTTSTTLALAMIVRFALQLTLAAAGHAMAACIDARESTATKRTIDA
jgi:hypothetical protein